MARESLEQLLEKENEKGEISRRTNDGDIFLYWRYCFYRGLIGHKEDEEWQEFCYLLVSSLSVLIVVIDEGRPNLDLRTYGKLCMQDWEEIRKFCKDNFEDVFTASKSGWIEALNLKVSLDDYDGNNRR